MLQVLQCLRDTARANGIESGELLLLFSADEPPHVQAGDVVLPDALPLLAVQRLEADGVVEAATG